MPAALYPDLVVNGESVPHATVAAETQNHTAPRGMPGVAWRKAANAVAVRTLLLQESRRRGLSPDPDEVGPGRFETDEEALIRELLDLVISVEKPADEQIRAEWARQPSRFRTPPLWEVSHILCACDAGDEAAREMAHERAKALRDKAIGDPRGFAALATRESDCESKLSGGALGQLGPGDTVPEFEAALRTLAEGEIAAEPVLTRYGYHIIRMDAVAEGKILPFDAVRQHISDAMEKAAWTRKAKSFVDQLVESAEISGADLHSLRSRKAEQ